VSDLTACRILALLKAACFFNMWFPTAHLVLNGIESIDDGLPTATQAPPVQRTLAAACLRLPVMLRLCLQG
jgi:hypothetical protein